MSVAQRQVAQQHVGRGGPSGLADVLEVLLDKGLVIDAYVRVSLIGIELLTVDARVVVASVDTYLRFAEAVNRLDLTQVGNAKTLGDLVSGESGGSRRRSGSSDDGRRRTLERARDGDDREDDAREEPRAEREEPADEPERDEEDVDTEPSGHDDETGDDEASDAAAEDREDDDAPGLLSRIKERGQAF